MTAKLVAVREAAAALGVCAETVKRAARDGRLRAVRLGGRWRIPVEEVERVAREGLPAPREARRAAEANHA